MRARYSKSKTGYLHRNVAWVMPKEIYFGVTIQICEFICASAWLVV
jgi:hypothetical protein